jgi:ABC-type microcin C transport system permease subunit YejB
VLVVALPLALLVGIVSACWHRRWADHLMSTGAIIGYSIPEFVIGTVLVILFAVMLPWFPATITVDTRGPVWELLQVSVPPVATIVIGSVAYLGRVLRVGMVEALNADQSIGQESNPRVLTHGTVQCRAYGHAPKGAYLCHYAELTLTLRWTHVAP